MRKLNVFYHGCRSIAEAILIANFPEPKPNVNGLGFYCSEDIEVAKRYGAYVIAIWTEQEADVTRPICNDPNMSVLEQVRAGMESIFVTKHSATTLFVNAEHITLQHNDVIHEDIL